MRTLAVLILIPVLIDSAPAQDCFEWSTLVDPLLGSYPTEGPIVAADAAGPFLCRAVDAAGGDRLVWCALDGGPEPFPLGSLQLTGDEVMAVRVVGTRVAVALVDGGWQVVDFTDPLLPLVTGAVAAGAGCRVADLHGDFVFAAEGTAGVGIYELMPGGPPVERNRLGGVVCNALDVDGDHCWFTGHRAWAEGDPEDFMSSGFAVLALVDATAPATAVESARREIGTYWGYTEDYGPIRAAGGRAAAIYTSSYTDEYEPWNVIHNRRVQFFDTTGLPALVPTGQFVHTLAASGLAMVAERAYLLADSQVRYYHHDGAAWTEAGHTLQAGSCAAATSAGVWIGQGSVQHALVPALADASPVLGQVYLPLGIASDLDAVDGYLLLREVEQPCDFCPPPSEMIAVLDTSDPPAPARVWYVASVYNGLLGRYAIDGDLIHAAAGIWNWRTGDQVAGTLPGVDDVLATIGDALWARNGADVLIFDVSVPASPAPVGTFLPGDAASWVAVDGDRAVLAAGADLIVADVSDPFAPQVLQRAAVSPGSTRDMILAGDLLLTADAGGVGVYLLDEAGMPTRVGGLAPGYVEALALDGPVLYATVDNEGLLAIDISAPAEPVEIGRVELSASPGDVVVHAGLVYVNDGRLQAVQAHCGGSVGVVPAELELAWRDGACRISWPMAGGLGTVRLLARAGERSWTVPWTATGDRAVAVDDAARPGDTVVYAWQVVRDGGWVTLAEKTLEIPSAVLALDGPVPNPFNPQTTLTFTLDRTGPTELALYDVAGRRVCTLLNEQLEAGFHSATWRGVDDAGRAVPAGAYFARLRTDGGERSVKLLLLK